ncbi:MAG: superoxide dismutase [Chitinophagales bacterium]|nr:superoxide dismutase [Chitinophagales bacterium]
MKKRKFLKISGIATAGAIASPLLFSSCKSDNKMSSGDKAQEVKQVTPFTLPELSFDYDSLEPHIDKMTMEIHHGKHHAGYVKKLNAAVADTDYEQLDIWKLMEEINEEETAVRNNGGGHFNHTIYWNSISDNSNMEDIHSDLKDAINSSFGSFKAFQKQFSEAAASQFGSGWAWLNMSTKKEKDLFISTTENQDNPAMKKIVDKSGIPILGIDVWEHAYYLNYENNRKDYISNFFKIINWDNVSSAFLC